MYSLIPFYWKDAPMFNKLVIKNTSINKVRPFFMEQVHLTQNQLSLWEDKMFHYKVLNKFTRNSELNFLVNVVNLILPGKSKDVQGFFHLSEIILSSEKELNFTSFFKKNNRPLNYKSSSNTLAN